jgi:signal transduction histidine kinase
MKNYFLLALFCLCIIRIYAQTEKSIDSLRQVLLTQNRSIVGDTTLVNLYCELGKEYTKNKSDSAIYYLQKALAISQVNTYNPGLLKTYMLLGRYYSVQFLPAKAIEFWFKSLAVAEQLNAPYEIRVLTNKIGEAYMSMKDYKKALAYFRKYSTMCKNSGNPEAYLLSLNSIGVLYFSKKDYSNALYYYNLCDSLNLTVNSPKAQTAALINIGKTQVELKNYGDALKRFKTAILIQDNYIDRIAFVGNEIAKVYLLKNNPEEALKYATLALKNVAKTNAQMNGELAKTLSEIHEKLNNYKLAHKYYKDYAKITLSEDSSKNTQLLRLVQLDYENEKSNERINLLNLDLKERQNNLTIMKVSIVSLLILIVIIAVYYQSLSVKNRLIETQKADIQRLNASLENKVAVRTEELTMANKELRRKNGEIRAALLKGQTMERERIASELHDNIGGTLSALKWRFEALDKDSLSEKEKKIYDGILKNMHKAYGEIRLISHNLLPAEFEEQGLIGALEKFLSDLNTTSSNLSKTRFSLDVSHLHKLIRQDVALELYICCFETINNIIKHAEATEVILVIREKENGNLEVSVQDDGNGFNGSLNKTGKGLKNIVGRLERIHAKLDITSTVEKGTRIVISVPESLWETYSTISV